MYACDFLQPRRNGVCDSALQYITMEPQRSCCLDRQTLILPHELSQLTTEDQLFYIYHFRGKSCHPVALKNCANTTNLCNKLMFHVSINTINTWSDVCIEPELGKLGFVSKSPLRRRKSAPLTSLFSQCLVATKHHFL